MASHRLLRLITRLNVGGPSRQALLLCKALADDYPTRLGAGRPTASEGEMLDPDVPVHHLPLVRSIEPREDMAAVHAVRQLLALDRPAILHTHMAKAGTVGRMAARTSRLDVRTVHTYHGHVLEGYFSPLKSRVFLEVERRLARSTDALIAISPEIRDQLLGFGIGRASQYHIVPLGFDLHRHLSVFGADGRLRAELGLQRETPLVGIVGRLVQIKDHATALRAIASLDHVHLAIVGDGELRAEIERLTDDLGVRPRVHFLGWRFDIPEVLADLDIVLLTSRNEGTPVSLIEAAACAKAVVATDVGGVRSVVQPGKTGLLVPAGDYRAVAAALQTLLAAPGTREAMGEASRISVARFSEDRLLRDIRGLYEDLLS